MQYIYQRGLLPPSPFFTCLFEMFVFSSMLGLVWTVNVFVSSVDVLGAAELIFRFFLRLLKISVLSILQAKYCYHILKRGCCYMSGSHDSSVFSPDNALLAHTCILQMASNACDKLKRPLKHHGHIILGLCNISVRNVLCLQLFFW